MCSPTPEASQIENAHGTRPTDSHVMNETKSSQETTLAGFTRLRIETHRLPPITQRSPPNSDRDSTHYYHSDREQIGPHPSQWRIRKCPGSWSEDSASKGEAPHKAEQEGRDSKYCEGFVVKSDCVILESITDFDLQVHRSPKARKIPANPAKELRRRGLVREPKRP